MGVGEQLDFHGVEPNALPTTARILHARVKVRIVPVRASAASRAIRIVKGTTSGVDGEWRAPVDVVEARVESFANIGNRHSHISRKFVTLFSPFHANSRVSCSRKQLKILKCCRTISCNATAAFRSPSRICVLPSEVRRVLEIGRGKFEGARRAISRAPRVGQVIAPDPWLGTKRAGSFRSLVFPRLRRVRARRSARQDARGAD